MYKLKIENPTNVITEEEIVCLYSGVSRDYLGLRDRAILSLIYCCGLRVKEVVGINIVNIFMEEENVRIKDAKSGNYRLVKLSNLAITDLYDYRCFSRYNLEKKRTGGEMFLNKKGRRLSVKEFKKRFKEILKNGNVPSGDPKYTLANLRSSVSVLMLLRGSKVSKIEEHFGYKNR